MRTRGMCLLLFVTAAVQPQAVAQHSDIFISVTANKMWTWAVSDPNQAEQVFDGELGELGIPGFTDDPGYNSGSLAGNSLLGYNVVGPLYFWDGAAFVAPPEDERLDILLSGTLLSTVTGSSGFQNGPYFTQASSSGGIHRHIQYWVRHPDFDISDPFDNPISPGAYALMLELTSSAHDNSDPFVIVFNNGLSPAEFEEAEDAAWNLLAGAPCAGDLTGDGQVTIEDLLEVLSGFGGGYGIEDLLAVLANFGTSC